jgi:hypothetical protein
MRLSDIGRNDAPLPADVEAELDALDAALRGEDVPPGLEGLEDLVSDMRAERSAPESDFGAALDRWAAAGFPRGRQPRLSERATRSDVGGRARAFLASLTPRRLAYAGGAAAALVVLVVAVSQIEFDNAGPADTADSGGEAATPEQTEPTVQDAGAAATKATEGRSSLGDSGLLREDAAARLENRDVSGFVPTNAGLARGEEDRKVERDAQMTLAAPADEVQDVTNEAIGVVESNGGIVESSQTSGTDERARATMQLAIPTRNLDATLDQLSDLADVKSLSEATVDITRPFVDAKDELAGLRAERASLYAQIEAADTQEELDQLRARLDALQDTIAKADADFENVRRRAALSSVTLQITSDGASSDDGDWSFDDALDDAGNVLTVGAGVALITAAVLLPIALIAAIIYFLTSAARGRARERALDQ